MDSPPADAAGRSERRRRERRSGERRSTERRADDRARTRFATITDVVWMVIGAAVVLYLFYLVIGNVSPSKASGASIAALVLAVLWLGRSWRRLWFGSASRRSDRERRGF